MNTINFELRTITPDDAAKLLERNTHNRNLRTNRAEQYASDMRAGRWVLTPNTIDLAADGTLLNGQHRLWAVVLSGKTQDFYFATDLDPAVQSVTDIGVGRTASDMLSLSAGAKNSAHCASAASVVLRYEETPNLVWSTAIVPSKTRILEWVLDNPSIHDATADGARVTKRNVNINRSAWCALAFLVRRDSSSPEMWGDFTEGVCSGANLAEGDGRLALRNWMSGGRATSLSGPWAQQHRLAIYIKAWNAFAKDAPVKILRFRREELPMPKVS